MPEPAPHTDPQPQAPWKRQTARIAWVLLALACATPWASPGVALVAGLAIALTLGNPFPGLIKKVSKPLLQTAVVLLGFGMNLHAVLSTARKGMVLAAVTIAVTFALGEALRRGLKLPRSIATLLSAGTAICGGSAMAAVALAIGAAEAELSVAMGTVFLLNAVALFLFPALGHLLGLTHTQFGTWAGIAIHDVSSVVGAASTWGQSALETATTVKLARTLWIAPVAVAAGLVFRRAGSRTPGSLARSAPVPWFIGLFLLASVAGTFVPVVHALAPHLHRAAKAGMTLTLLMIGTSLSRDSLRAVGWKPVALGLALWLAISVLSLLPVLGGFDS